MGSPNTPASHRAKWFREIADHKWECQLCPQGCRLSPEQPGFCGARFGTEDGIRTWNYGRHCGAFVDPIEKKPLFHFLPGTRTLSLGATGCNLACTFCQNWSLSRGSPEDLASEVVEPQALATAALSEECASIAFTYNEPILSAEFIVEAAAACHDHGLRTIAVTNGFISDTARGDFFAAIDAANVDLKSFSDDFYRRQCKGRLQPVLDTISYLARSRTWLEVTTLIIPGLNDDQKEIEALCAWLVDHAGPDVPLHFSAFHPAGELRDVPCTPAATLEQARETALRAGLRYVYLGNVAGNQITLCPGCGATLLRRRGFFTEVANCRDGICTRCNAALPGVFRV